MITNGIITEALNPENEGLSVRAVLTREVEALYKLINALNNIYVKFTHSERQNKAIQAGFIPKAVGISSIFKAVKR